MPLLLKATPATCLELAGFTFVPVDVDELADYKAAAYAQGVAYGFGSKDPNPGCGVIDYTDIDCSGFFRTMTDYITHDILRDAGLPDGSAVQADWLKTQGFKHHEITSAKEYLDTVTTPDNLYRVCFHYPSGRGGDSTGHVWVAVHNHSVESYGGHGPGERPLDYQWFVDHCDLVVVLGPLVTSDSWSYE